jgi:hypothetical protein
MTHWHVGEAALFWACQSQLEPNKNFFLRFSSLLPVCNPRSTFKSQLQVEVMSSAESLVTTVTVLIDDTNPSIQYSGPWFEVNNTQLNTGVFGPPFQNTLHGVNISANFSFPFSGMSHLLILLY